MAKTLITMRLDADLAAWALSSEGGRTGVVEGLLRALRERRVVVLPSPAPYWVNQGDDQENPVLMSMNSPTKEKP